MKKLFLLILLLIPLLFNVSCNDEENKEVITYTVSFVNDDILEEVTVKENDKVSKPVDPVKDGFEFIGWYLNDELFNFDSPITSNITLNAKYEEVIKTYNVLVVFDNNEMKFNDITELSLTDITKIDGYEYIGLYTDSLYQNEFSGSLTSDMTLYLKYKKYHSVLVKTDKEEISLKVYHGEKIDTNIFYEKGYKNCLYYDNTFKFNMYANPLFYAEDEKVYTDIELTLVEGLAVSFYEEGLLKERIVVRKNRVLDNELYKYKYSNYELYTDKEYKTKYNYKTKITEDTNIYLKPIKVDDTKVKVQINIKDSINKFNHIQIFYIDKGEYLRRGDIGNLLTNFNIYVDINIFLYYDEECTNLYNYGKVYEDIVLYGRTTPKELCERVMIQIFDVNSNEDVFITDFNKGSIINEDYALITSGKQFDGFYYDAKFTKPYNNEPIYVDTELFMKTKDFESDDVIHNVKFYLISDFYQNGIEGLVKELSTGYYKPRINTYVKDGYIIKKDQYKVSTIGFSGSVGIYNVTNKCIYNGEPITEDTEFILLTYNYLAYGSFDFEWKIEIKKINYNRFVIFYNDDFNKNITFIPSNNQKTITIIDEEYNTYQMFVSVNSVILKEELLNIMKAKNINTENIEVSDIFVTEDVVIKIK